MFYNEVLDDDDDEEEGAEVSSGDSEAADQKSSASVVPGSAIEAMASAASGSVLTSHNVGPLTSRSCIDAASRSSSCSCGTVGGKK